MRFLKPILWGALLVTLVILFLEEKLWGPNQSIRFTVAAIHYGTMPLLYLVYLVQGVLRTRGDRRGLVRFLVVYHVWNVPLFVAAWIASWILEVLVLFDGSGIH